MRWHAACLRLPRCAGPLVVFAIPALLLAAPQSARAQSAMFDNFTKTSPKAGEMAPDFSLLTLDNAVREAYGSLPNSAYTIARDGKIVLKEPWSKADGWAPALDSLLAGGG